MKDYTSYQAADLVTDSDFLQWVKHAAPESDRFWQAFLLAHPEKAPVVDEARAIILSVVTGDDFSAGEIALLRQQVQAIAAAPISRTIPLRNRLWYWAAALVAGLLLLTAFFFYRYANALVTVRSQYAEKKQVVLPDGTVVMLNANSSLSWKRSFGKGRREVWLEGEAFLQVNPRPGHYFALHANGVQVTVLGTAFNVFSRRNNVRVSLNSGRLKVNFEQLPDSLLLSPGDIVEYAALQQQYSSRKGNAAHLSLWTENRIITDNTPVAEIIQLLADNYGLAVQCTDSSILRKRLTGELLTDNETVLLRALSTTLEVPITKKDNVVIMGKEQ